MTPIEISSWIQAFFTIVLVVATISYVKATKNIADYTKNQTIMMDKPIISTEYIGGHLAPNDELEINIKVKNIGKAPALNFYTEMRLIVDKKDDENYYFYELPIRNDMMFKGFLGIDEEHTIESKGYKFGKGLIEYWLEEIYSIYRSKGIDTKFIDSFKTEYGDRKNRKTYPHAEEFRKIIERDNVHFKNYPIIEIKHFYKSVQGLIYETIVPIKFYIILHGIELRFFMESYGKISINKLDGEDYLFFNELSQSNKGFSGSVFNTTNSSIDK